MSKGGMVRIYPVVEYTNYIPIITAISLNLTELCKVYLDEYPDISIPIEIVKGALVANRVDIVMLLIPRQVSYKPNHPSTFDILQIAYRLSNFTLWQHLLVNGYDLSKRMGDRSALHLLHSESHRLIIFSITEFSPPLTPSSNQVDMEFIRSVITRNSDRPVLFAILPPNKMIIDTSSTFTELLLLAVTHHNRVAFDWLMGEKHSVIANNLFPLSYCLEQMIASTNSLSDDDIAMMLVLLQRGAQVRDTIEYYRFINKALFAHRDWEDNPVCGPAGQLLVTVVEMMITQAIISVNGKDTWLSTRNKLMALIRPTRLPPLIYTVMCLPQHSSYRLMKLLLAQGSVIPSKVYKYLDSVAQPTTVIERALKEGYTITINSILNYERRRCIRPGALHGCDCRLPKKYHDKYVDDDGIITILQRDGYTYNDAFWSKLRRKILSSTQHISSLKRLIEYEIKCNRYELLDLFTTHGFVFPNDCVGSSRRGVDREWKVLHQHIHPHMLSHVLPWGIPLNQLDSYRRTPLDCAIDRMRFCSQHEIDPCDVHVALRLFSMGGTFGPSIDLRDPSILHTVIALDNCEMLQSLLDAGIDPRSTSHTYFPLLHVKSYPVARLLVDHGFDVNTGNPLLLVRDVSIAQLLIDHGANVNAGDPGNTPIIHAMLNRNWPLVQLFIEHNADVNNNYDLGESVVTRCMRLFNDASKVRYLLDHGYTIIQPDSVFSMLTVQNPPNVDMIRLVISHCHIDLMRGDYFAHLVSYCDLSLIEELMDDHSIRRCLSFDYAENTKDFYHYTRLRKDPTSIRFLCKYGVDFNDQRVMYHVSPNDVNVITQIEHGLGHRLQFHPVHPQQHNNSSTTTPTSTSTTNSATTTATHNGSDDDNNNGITQHEGYSHIDAGVLQSILVHRNWAVAWALIRRGANVNAVHDSHFTLSLVIRTSPRDKVYVHISEMIRYGAHVHPISPIPDDLPLVLTIKQRDWDAVKLLIHHGADVMTSFTKDNPDHQSILQLFLYYLTHPRPINQQWVALCHLHHRSSSHDDGSILSLITPQLFGVFTEMIQVIKSSPTYNDSLLSRVDARGRKAVEYIDPRSPQFDLICSLLVDE